MTPQLQTDARSRPTAAATLELLRREASAGAGVALTMLAASLATGALVATPLGNNYAAFGVAAAISGAVIGGGCAALLASSSAIMWGPLPTVGFVQASLVAALMSHPVFATHPSAAVAALFVCIALAGLLQVGCGVSGFANLVKYTPHPVVAGFMNGIAATILLSQIKLFFPFDRWWLGASLSVVRPSMFAFAAALVAFTFWFASRIKRIPAPLVCLLIGTAGYYLVNLISHGIDLGPTLGRLPVDLGSMLPIANVFEPENQRFLFSAVSDIVLFAIAIVIVGSLQSLLVFKMAEKLSDVPIRSGRGLVALGVADIVSASAGGFAISVGAPMTAAAIRNGGRTRLVGLSASAALFLLTILIPGVLGAIPRVSIIALLAVVSIMAFDRWSLRLLWSTLSGLPQEERRRAIYDLAVVLIVMGVTLAVSIIMGILAGLVAACITFVFNMSHPIVRTRHAGTDIRSNHVRTAAQSAFLHEQGERWRVLRIGGVFFFGNAETLTKEVLDAFKIADFVVLDCRGITDIDITGATIISSLVEKSRKLAKNLTFCNVPREHENVIRRAVGKDAAVSIFKDLDSALEAIEERVLWDGVDVESGWGPVELAEHALLSGLDQAERDVMASILTPRKFEKGASLAAENDAGDRMWLIMKGTVNVCLHTDHGLETRRIASLGAGTTAGEMVLIEDAGRSASLIAAEDVVCWELKRWDYDRLTREHPQIGQKLLTNLLREMAHRLRSTSDQLRAGEV